MSRRHPNPVFQVDTAQVRAERARMRRDPRPLERPVVILAGWRSPRLQGFGLADKLAPLTSGRAEDYIRIAYPLVGDLERALARVRTVLSQRGVGGGRNEVDVVGISMGGLVARMLAAQAESDGPVRIRRLFTI